MSQSCPPTTGTHQQIGQKMIFDVNLLGDTGSEFVHNAIHFQWDPVDHVQSQQLSMMHDVVKQNSH